MLPQIRYNLHLFYSVLKKKKLKAHLCKSSDTTWRKSKHSAWNAPKVSWISTSLRSPPPHFPTEQPREQCLFFSWSLRAQSCQSLTDGDHPSVLAQMMAVKVDCHAVMAFQQSKLYWFWKIEGVGQWLETSDWLPNRASIHQWGTSCAWLQLTCIFFQTRSEFLTPQPTSF